jgi:hypothetical protein
MGVLGAPLKSAGAITSIYKYLSCLSMRKLINLPVLNMINMGNSHIKPPPYEFLNLYGACLQAPRTTTEDPKNEVVDNLPRYPC